MITIENLNFYTKKEVCEKLKISNYSLSKYIKEGRLAAVKRGHTWYIESVNLANFLKGD